LGSPFMLHIQFKYWPHRERPEVRTYQSYRDIPARPYPATVWAHLAQMQA